MSEKRKSIRRTKKRYSKRIVKRRTRRNKRRTNRRISHRISRRRYRKRSTKRRSNKRRSNKRRTKKRNRNEMKGGVTPAGALQYIARNPDVAIKAAAVAGGTVAALGGVKAGYDRYTEFQREKIKTSFKRQVENMMQQALEIINPKLPSYLPEWAKDAGIIQKDEPTMQEYTTLFETLFTKIDQMEEIQREVDGIFPNEKSENPHEDKKTVVMTALERADGIKSAVDVVREARAIANIWDKTDKISKTYQEYYEMYKTNKETLTKLCDSDKQPGEYKATIKENKEICAVMLSVMQVELKLLGNASTEEPATDAAGAKKETSSDTVAQAQLPDDSEDRRSIYMKDNTKIVVCTGNLLEFGKGTGWPKGSIAIVNAANEEGLDGGDGTIDGRINKAAGGLPTKAERKTQDFPLMNDRKKLPFVANIPNIRSRTGLKNPHPVPDSYTKIRIRTGDAVVTGPNHYGKLECGFVIHAVGPNYSDIKRVQDQSVGEAKKQRERATPDETSLLKEIEDNNHEAARVLLASTITEADGVFAAAIKGANDAAETAIKEADRHLLNAYRRSMHLAEEKGIEYLGFSLLSTGVFLGTRNIDDLLKIAVQGILDCTYPGLKEVHLFAFQNKGFFDTLCAELLLRPGVSEGVAEADPRVTQRERINFSFDYHSPLYMFPQRIFDKPETSYNMFELSQSVRHMCIYTPQLIQEMFHRLIYFNLDDIYRLFMIFLLGIRFYIIKQTPRLLEAQENDPPLYMYTQEEVDYVVNYDLIKSLLVSTLKEESYGIVSPEEHLRMTHPQGRSVCFFLLNPVITHLKSPHYLKENSSVETADVFMPDTSPWIDSYDVLWSPGNNKAILFDPDRVRLSPKQITLKQQVIYQPTVELIKKLETKQLLITRGDNKDQVFEKLTGFESEGTLSLIEELLILQMSNGFDNIIGYITDEDEYYPKSCLTINNTKGPTEYRTLHAKLGQEEDDGPEVDS